MKPAIRPARIMSSRCRPPILPTSPGTPASSSDSALSRRLARRAPSEMRAAGEEGLGASADPDIAVPVAVDLDAPAPAEPCALGRHIRRRRAPRAEQPLRRRSIEAAGDRVLEQAAMMVAEEDAQLERDLRSLRIGPYQADVDALGMMARRLHREHLLGRFHQHTDPA